MSIWAGRDSWPLGASNFVQAFFSTVAARLEGDSWGTRFPNLMLQLYAGELPAANLDAAEVELDEIERGLGRLPPSALVWDFNDRDRPPPWRDDISPQVSSLGNYFMTSDGRPFFEVFRSALRAARSKRVPLRIE